MKIVTRKTTDFRVKFSQEDLLKVLVRDALSANPTLGKLSQNQVINEGKATLSYHNNGETILFFSFSNEEEVEHQR